MTIIKERAEQSVPARPLTGKVVFVTGASRGIGAAIARDLAIAGATTLINFISHDDEARALRDELQSLGASVDIEHADVREYAEMERAMARVVETHGKVDVLINNAGILRDRSFKNMSEQEWEDVIRTNLTGVFNGCRAVTPHMIAAGGGSIVNISSVIGQTGNFGQANYAAAKAGILGLTKTLALELARYTIRVNAICPGFVNTAMWTTIPANVQASIVEKIPLGRPAEPSEIAHAVRFLIDAAYVTGETLNVNGGLSMR